MQVTKGAFAFIRQIGVGEREHVRQGLLGVGFFSKEKITDQIQGALRAANKLGMMLRVHVNIDQRSPAEVESMYRLMRDNVDHQFEPWSHLNQAAFESMCSKLEVVIMSNGATTGDVQADVELGVLEVWKESGGRFLKGNFAELGTDKLKLKYPEFYYDIEPFWDAWNA